MVPISGGSDLLGTSAWRAVTLATRRNVLDMGCDGRNTPRDVPDDLLHLEDFNDAELLRSLWSRYERREIYTWVGSVLVSVNPYRDIGAFHPEVASRYAAKSPPQAPHLYAIVNAAIAAPGGRHALLITGESGAGKTEATRAALSFLAMRHNADDTIRDRLLSSTPVLEAFGNAHTRQNTNSSRFGKFVEVHLSAAGSIVGATVRPYMLETSRVAGGLVQGEKTYHIFYFLRAALDALTSGTAPPGPFWARLAHSPEWSDIVRAGGGQLSKSERLAGGPSEGICLKLFETLHESLTSTGMQHSEIAECSRMISAVGLLAEETISEEEFGAAAALLRIPASALKRFLTTTETMIGSARQERMVRGRSEHESATLRASLAQELYASLFSWITRLVAKGIAPPEDLHGGRMLGLLDLYGFEVFEKNGFEQFLINYCNERLQQFFNRQVFTREAEEYAAEGLDSDGQWLCLTMACQLPALALLEGEKFGSVGVFGVINDRSRCGFENADGVGNAVVESIVSACRNHPAFRKASRDCGRCFGVAHFAGEVQYDASQFVRKNASAHRPDIVAFLRQNGGSFIRDVFASEVTVGDAVDGDMKAADGEESKGGRRKLFGRTLISVFREELQELCTVLEARDCRHVRCLRPNDSQTALVFDDVSMLRQCRYSGLLEATRIRKQGYAHRRPMRTFAARYALILPAREERRKARRVSASGAALICSAICDTICAGGIDSQDARTGHSKVFLRETALKWLEEKRQHVAATHVVAALRALHASRQFIRVQCATRRLQAACRGHIVRVRVMREIYALRCAEAEAAAAAARVAAELAEVLAHSSARVIQRWWQCRLAKQNSIVAALLREQDKQRWLEHQVHQVEMNLLSSPSVNCLSPPNGFRDCHQKENLEPIRKTSGHSGKPPKEGTQRRTPLGGVVANARPQRRNASTRTRTPTGACIASPPQQRRLEQPPSSPRTLRESYRRDIAKLLAQHRALRQHLPSELRAVPAQLTEASNALANNVRVPPEILMHIGALLETIKNALKEAGLGFVASPNRHVNCGGGPGTNSPGCTHVDSARVNWGGEVRSHRRTRSPIVSASVIVPLQVDMQHDVGLTPKREVMRRSVSARSVLAAPSPRGVCRSPLLTPRDSSVGFRTPISGFRTPVRSTECLPTAHAISMRPSTPRLICRAQSENASTWTWQTPVVDAVSSVSLAALPTPCRSFVPSSPQFVSRTPRLRAASPGLVAHPVIPLTAVPIMPLTPGVPPAIVQLITAQVLPVTAVQTAWCMVGPPQRAGSCIRRCVSPAPPMARVSKMQHR